MIRDAWMRTAERGGNGAVYIVIHKYSAMNDALVGASAEIAQAVEIHESQIVDDIMQMRMLSSVELASGEDVKFEPGGLHIMLVNLKSMWLTCKHVIPVMREQKSGSIVNISSVNGLVSEPFLAVYSASKGAIVMLTRGVALDYALGWGLDAIWERVRSLGELLRETLAGIPGVVVQDIGAERYGIGTLTVDGVPAREVQRNLAAQAMNVTVSSVASTRFDMEARCLTEVVRASVHYYDDEAEVERFCAAVRAIAGS